VTQLTKHNGEEAGSGVVDFEALLTKSSKKRQFYS
jgi:hypothetical protein